MGTTKATDNRTRETDRVFREITEREAVEKQAKSARLRAERDQLANKKAGAEQERGVLQTFSETRGTQLRG